MPEDPEAYQPDNIFAKILDGVFPSYKVFEDETAVAILDAFPVAPGHTLLLPKKRGYRSVMDMPETDAGEFLKLVPKIAAAVKAGTGADAVNVLTNLGAASGQVVFHPHVHFIPRYKDDGLWKPPASAKDKIADEDANAMLEKIKAKL
ncbi:unnamed protein product [Amoebophrya sp. A120]|nr:unnamed protein product [Amoebophrya sp. A120]|eukprot:GSA120T00017378001.1